MSDSKRLLGWMSAGAAWRAICVLLVCAVAVMTHAQTVTATFSFVKKPPRGAVLYAADGNYPLVSSIEVDQEDKAFTASMYVISPGAKALFKNSEGFLRING